MRTPAAMIVGMVLAPCALVLTLAATVAPNWRTLASSTANKPTDEKYHQGIWDICAETLTYQNTQCGLTNDDYFNNQVVQVARALMITSLVVTALGIALASWGVRCWEDAPNFLIAGFGGLVIFISGVLCLIPISWYNYKIYSLLASDTASTSAPSIYVGYCLVLGYLGSCIEIIGGASLMLCFIPPCKKCMQKKRKATSSMYYSKKEKPNKNGNPSQVYSIDSRYGQQDSNPNKVGYSIHNDSYKHEAASRNGHSVVSSDRSYINAMDVTAGEYPRSKTRAASQLSSLPCDSDLL